MEEEREATHVYIHIHFLSSSLRPFSFPLDRLRTRFESKGILRPFCPVVPRRRSRQGDLEYVVPGRRERKKGSHAVRHAG